MKAAWARGDFSSEEYRRKKSEAAKAAHERGDYNGHSESIKAAWARGDRGDKEWCHKISEVTKAAWARGCYDGVFQSPTSIELQIAAALDDMEIEHQAQYRPEGYGRIFDELIPPNTLIEIQGNYWHGEDFPETQKRDAEKAQWAKENGFELITIWEHEIKERGALAIIAEVFGYKEAM